MELISDGGGLMRYVLLFSLSGARRSCVLPLTLFVGWLCARSTVAQPLHPHSYKNKIVPPRLLARLSIPFPGFQSPVGAVLLFRLLWASFPFGMIFSFRLVLFVVLCFRFEQQRLLLYVLFGCCLCCSVAFCVFLALMFSHLPRLWPIPLPFIL